MSNTLLRREAVLQRTGLTASALYRKLDDQSFPRPITISGTRVKAWVSAEVDAWVEAQISASRGIPNPKDDNHV